MPSLIIRWSGSSHVSLSVLIATSRQNYGINTVPRGVLRKNVILNGLSVRDVQECDSKGDTGARNSRDAIVLILGVMREFQNERATGWPPLVVFHESYITIAILMLSSAEERRRRERITQRRGGAQRFTESLAAVGTTQKRRGGAALQIVGYDAKRRVAT